MSDDLSNLQSAQARSANSTNTFLVVALVALSGIVAYQSFFRPFLHGGSAAYSSRPVTPRGELGASESDRIQVFQQTSPSVVFIRTKGRRLVGWGDVREQELSSGTGFVWDELGHIVTNLHVVEAELESPNTALEVQFSDGTVVDAEIVGGVAEHDIAILKVEASAATLVPIMLGTSNDLQVGQNVVAIGNPFGFDQTLSGGIIGGLDRSVGKQDGTGSLAGLIQTDAAINPGNSGGPLLDSAGRLVGVNTAIVSPTGAYAGLGFAVPVDNVVKAVESVLELATGDPMPWLGVTIFDQERLARMGLSEEVNRRGLFMSYISPNGPVAATDLQPIRQTGFTFGLGDQIIKLNDAPVTSHEELERELRRYSPGDVVQLTVIRRERMGTVDVKLQARKVFR